jgi:hypothetical protein
LGAFPISPLRSLASTDDGVERVREEATWAAIQALNLIPVSRVTKILFD